ncbi:MAG TPA: hypothetical protein VNM48_09995 [Chloroflexota bacterium]|nr:hypothetical protein [Chloroflexota bacterium]
MAAAPARRCRLPGEPPPAYPYEAHDAHSYRRRPMEEVRLGDERMFRPQVADTPKSDSREHFG